MRDLINKVSKLYEIPSMASGRLDFGLSNVENNRNMAQTLLARNDKTIILEKDEFVLFRVGSSFGTISLYNKKTGLIDYLVEFETTSRKLTGSTVTQVKLWRYVNIPYFTDVTTYVFFEYLLPTFRSIMSDEQQTEDGKRFWLRVMGLASHRGMQVGFVDFNGSKLELFQPAKWIDVVEWATNLNAWGNGDRFSERRFFIQA